MKENKNSLCTHSLFLLSSAIEKEEDAINKIGGALRDSESPLPHGFAF
jgi:hypothetical protein